MLLPHIPNLRVPFTFSLTEDEPTPVTFYCPSDALRLYGVYFCDLYLRLNTDLRLYRAIPGLIEEFQHSVNQVTGRAFRNQRSRLSSLEDIARGLSITSQADDRECYVRRGLSTFPPKEKFRLDPKYYVEPRRLILV